MVCREANGRRIALSDSVKIREETVPVYLGLLHPHLQRYERMGKIGSMYIRERDNLSLKLGR